MNFLIAESGATKTAWRVCEGGEIVETFHSLGFNPNSTDKAAWFAELEQLQRERLHAYHFEQFFYYGAGLRREVDQQAMLEALSKQFADAKVYVEHDLTAAIRSSRRERGIVCILGTGSNACSYKNFEISLQLGGHGYLLGDEGSGMDLGKCLLRGILQGDFPKEAQSYVEEKEALDIFAIRSKMYASPHPPRSLAEFSRHLDDLRQIEAIRKMIIDRFLIFLETTVCRISNYEILATDFVGGVSHYFEDLLKIACQQRNVHWGRIIRHPIDELVKYHVEYS